VVIDKVRAFPLPLAGEGPGAARSGEGFQRLALIRRASHDAFSRKEKGARAQRSRSAGTNRRFRPIEVESRREFGR